MLLSRVYFSPVTIAFLFMSISALSMFKYVFTMFKCFFHKKIILTQTATRTTVSAKLICIPFIYILVYTVSQNSLPKVNASNIYIINKSLNNRHIQNTCIVLRCANYKNMSVQVKHWDTK